MELYQQIFLKALDKMDRKLFVPGFTIDAEKIVQMECYKALQKIKEIIEDETLDDPECFIKIEEIISLLEEMGIPSGMRHDFG